MWNQRHTDRSYLPNRFERKYLISEAKARAIRSIVQPFVSPDAYLTSAQPRGYGVYSLYLDSPALSLYEATASGLKNRYKLRIRYYDQNPASPVFFEVKRRLDQVVRKRRVAVKRTSLSALLNGGAPGRQHLHHPEDDFEALVEFCRLRTDLSALGTVIVGYLREAYVDGIGGRNRLTFDRELRAKPFCWYEGLVSRLPLVRTQGNRVVLELKYVDCFPRWMQELVHMFDLERLSVPKYGWSVESIGRPAVVSHVVNQERGQVPA